MSTEPAAMLERFYTAFQDRDAYSMTSCYAATAAFRDPVFDLRGAHIGNMWKMLCSRSAELRIEFANPRVDGERGIVEWQAWYPFSATGRPVHNVVKARFRFADGLIAEHIDEFDFWRWSRQALGTPGLLLGWSPLLRNKVRAQAARALEQYESTR